MNRRCENNVTDHAVDVCDSCYGEFCDECLIYPKTRSHPICKECGLIASGVRGNTKVKKLGDKKSARSRREELHAAVAELENESKTEIKPIVYESSPVLSASEWIEQLDEEPETKAADVEDETESEELIDIHSGPEVSKKTPDTAEATSNSFDSESHVNEEQAEDDSLNFDIEQNASRLSASFIERKTRAARRVELKSPTEEIEQVADFQQEEPFEGTTTADLLSPSTTAVEQVEELEPHSEEVEELLIEREKAMREYLDEIETTRNRKNSEPEPVASVPEQEIEELSDTQELITGLDPLPGVEPSEAAQPRSETSPSVDPISAKYGNFRDTRKKRTEPTEVSPSQQDSSNLPESLKAKTSATEPLLPRHHIDEEITHVEFDDLKMIEELEETDHTAEQLDSPIEEYVPADEIEEAAEAESDEQDSASVGNEHLLGATWSVDTAPTIASEVDEPFEASEKPFWKDNEDEIEEPKQKKTKSSKFGWLTKQKQDIQDDDEELLEMTKPSGDRKKRRKEDLSEDLIQLTSSRPKETSAPESNDLSDPPPEPIYSSNTTDSEEKTKAIRTITEITPTSPEDFWAYKISSETPEYSGAVTV